MNIDDLRNRMSKVPPPIQPWLKVNSIDYIEKLIRLNPVCSKSNGLFYQFTTSSTEECKIKIMPDTCATFYFSCDSLKPSAKISGINSKCHDEIMKPNTTYFCVKPYSTFATKGWRVSPKELYSKDYDLKDVLVTKNLEVKVAEARSFDERVNIFKNYFIENWLDENYSMGLEEIVAMILCVNCGNISMMSIEDITGYTRRYCEKKFVNSYNISMKKYGRLVRFQNTIRMLLNSNTSNITEIAYGNKYFDEAHFIKDFKSYTKLSPEQFKKNLAYA